MRAFKRFVIAGLPWKPLEHLYFNTYLHVFSTVKCFCPFNHSLFGKLGPNTGQSLYFTPEYNSAVSISLLQEVTSVFWRAIEMCGCVCVFNCMDCVKGSERDKNKKKTV